MCAPSDRGYTIATVVSYVLVIVMSALVVKVCFLAITACAKGWLA